MDRYRLNRWYTQLPESWQGREIIVEKRTNPDHYEVINVSNFSPVFLPNEIENKPNYWKQCTFKILTFRYKNNGNLWHRVGNKFTFNGIMHSEGYFLDSVGQDAYEIYSVKRLPDGEEFTIGDHITGEYFRPAGDVRTISQMEIKDNGELRIYQDGGYSDIREIERHRPLLTTEEGIDKFPGESCWIVQTFSDGDYMSTRLVGSLTEDDLHKHYTYFHKERNADEYKLKLLRHLCVKDVEGILSQPDIQIDPLSRQELLGKIKDLAEERS